MHPETKRAIEAYRKRHQAECLGQADITVEAMMTGAEELSTEVLTYVLRGRGYDVTLERGWR